MEYILISDGEPDSLNDRVNALIKAGFEPLGGVAVSQSTVKESNGYCEQDTIDITFCQAMIKR